MCLQDEDSAASEGSGSSSLEASLSAAATRVKQKGAEEFVERLSAALAGKEAAAQVQVDPLLIQSGTQRLGAGGAGKLVALANGSTLTIRCAARVCVGGGDWAQLAYGPFIAV
jgi:hypothetical protein